jgi:serine/threonine-protein kinase
MAEAARYHAIRKIADGGSAEVFLGEQQGAAGFRRPVVLKRIRPALYADEHFRELLVEEAHLAMSLHHPNLVEVLDLGASNGRYFLVLELVDGWTLGQVARRGREAGLPLPPELCVYLAAEICRGLAYAHQRTRGGEPLGVVHRDVCPNNVLVSMHAEVKVTDFGIARASTRNEHTRSGLIRGKPMYMSPEQARGDALDGRSDLFSVGTVLFQLLTGQLPFPGPSDQEFLGQICNGDAPSPCTLRPELPQALCALVQKAMARQRDARFHTAQEMLVALEHVQRTALTPAGRSELEHYLRALSAKDGELAITRQTMPPAPPVDEPEWISLSAEQAVVDDQTATQQEVPLFAAPPPPPPRASRAAFWLVVLGTATLVGGAGLWWSHPEQSAATPDPTTSLHTEDRAGPIAQEPGTTDRSSEEPAPEESPAASVPTGDLAIGDAGAGAAPTDEVTVASAPNEGGAAEEAPNGDTPEEAELASESATNAALPPSGAGTEDSSRATPGATSSGEPGPVASPAETARADERPSRSGTAGLRLSARLAPGQSPGQPRVAVLLESQPPGVSIRVDRRVLGRTPVTLQFRNGVTFDVWFEAPGRPALRQWLMLTDRPGRLPKITLRDPVEPL